MGNAKAIAKKQKLPFSDLSDIIRELVKRYVLNPNLSHYGLIMSHHVSSSFCPHCKQIILGSDLERCSHCKGSTFDTGEFIFLSSSASLKTMLEMNEGNTMYGRSCHVDHQPGRTRQFTTFEAVTFDPDACCVATLFTVHMLRETELHVSAAFTHLQNLLKIHCSEDATFDPHGFVSDEAGSLIGGIKQIFPQSSVTTDSFHYRQNVMQLVSDAVGSRDDNIRFVKMAVALQEAATPSVYEATLTKFNQWVNQLPSRKNKISPYIKWWNFRRSHWSTAFKNNDVDSHSLAEAGNSSMGRKNIMKNSAIDRCIRWEMNVYMKYHMKLEGLVKGTFQGGRGPSRAALNKREMDAIHRRIESTPLDGQELNAIVNELMSSINLPIEDPSIDDLDTSSIIDTDMKQVHETIRPSSSHKYKAQDPSSRGVLKKAGRPPGSRNKKRKVTISDTIEYSSEGVEIEEGRTSGSKWRYESNKVRRMLPNYKVKSEGNLVFTVNKSEAGYETKTVSFHNGIADCTPCMRFDGLKMKDPLQMTANCKHVIFVMRTIGVDESDPLQLKHKLSMQEISRLQSLEAGWLMNTLPSSVSTSTSQGGSSQAAQSSSSTTLKVGTVHKTYSSHAEALNDCCKSIPRWHAEYYIKDGKRGATAKCSTTFKTHKLRLGEACLRVEYERVFPTQDKKKPKGLKTEQKYFCFDINCIQSPIKSLNSNYTNFKIPALSDISRKNLNDCDHHLIDEIGLP